jgi:hypothetical protein
MEIFISWSGEPSGKIARSLERFLGDVIQGLEPFISFGIEKGTRWRDEIGKRLERCKYGVVVLTKENMQSPWLVFEAGALSRDVASGRVMTVLAGLNNSDVEGPLGQFQHTGIRRDEILGLVCAINNLLTDGGQLSDERLGRAFDRSWPDLEKEVAEALSATADTAPAATRSAESMAAETLELVRELVRRANNGFPDSLMPFAITNGAASIVEGSDRVQGFATIDGKPTDDLPIATPTATSDPVRSRAHQGRIVRPKSILDP